MIVPDAYDVNSDRDPLDWYIEICAVCGCQLGPGIGSRTQTGRCVVSDHRRVGGTVVRVQALPLDQQEESTARHLKQITEPIPIARKLEQT
jgi:hypothetical protein